MAIWESFKKGLSVTREVLSQRLSGRGGSPLMEALEEALLLADLGWEPTEAILNRLGRLREEERIPALKTELLELAGKKVSLQVEGRPAVIVFVGVNGSGKTTTLGKVACRLAQDGKKVLVAAGDTFRAAAAEQVETWAKRAGADIVSQAPGADPAAVAFDGYRAALARGADVLLVDTAGRLQTRLPLMEELKKILRVLEREMGRSPDEVLLVLDGTSGQNAIHQAKAFSAAVSLTGLVVTKLDASAKGGAVLAARGELGVPVKLVGLGEGQEDLLEFDPELFVESLLVGIGDRG